MTDPQTMTLALAQATAGSPMFNTRITDVKETQRAEMVATTESLRAEMAAGFRRISNEILSLKADLKIHGLEHHHK